MPTFNFSDHVHLERFAPDKTTDIYYDATEEFKQRFSEFYLAYEQTNAQVESSADYFLGLSQAIEREFGPLTIAQLLLIVHVFASRLGQNYGYHIGFQHGSEQMLAQCLDKMMNDQPSVIPAGYKGKPGATA